MRQFNLQFSIYNCQFSMLFCYSKKSSVPSSVPSSVSSVPSVPSVVQKLRSELPMSSMPFKSGDRILFQGDSITDCGCRDTSNENPLGTGYVSIVRGLLSARHPDLAVTIL